MFYFLFILIEILAENEKKRSTNSIGTQTDNVEKNSAYAECNIGNHSQILSTKRKLSQHDEKVDCHLSELDQESISSSVENYSPIDVEPNSNDPKKRRLIIGKNVEKIPELTFSTIERSLDAFINDAASNFCQLKENRKEKSPEINHYTKLDPKSNMKLVNSQNFGQQNQRQNQSILVDLVTGQTSGMANNQIFSQSQQTPLVILPSNIESPVVSRMHPIQKEPAKNIQPIVIEPFQKVHLTNAINLAGQVVDSNIKARTNQIKNTNTNIKPKPDSKTEDTSVEIFPKKKKVYNRVTPTIRAIYEKEQQNKEESQPKTGDAEPKQDDGEFKDVHDEIADIFDMSCRKANLNTSNSSDITLDDICVRTSSKSNQSGKKICKVRKSLDKKDCNEEEDLDKIATNNQAPTSTRTLRSRTNSQRKNF